MPLVISSLLLGAQKMATHADVDLTSGTVKLLDADPNRTTVFIFNLGAAAVRLGDAGTGAARGAPLAANAGITIETTDAIYAYSASAATLAILEALRP